MAQKKKKTRPRKKKAKQFRFQLGWAGIAGIGVVCSCLFLWMFLLGIWAGQTILLPAAADIPSSRKLDKKADSAPGIQTITPDGKKKPVARDNGKVRVNPLQGQ